MSRQSVTTGHFVVADCSVPDTVPKGVAYCCSRCKMVHTAAAKGSAALTKRQRRKTGKCQYDAADAQVAVRSDSYPIGQLEPQATAQHQTSHKLSSDASGSGIAAANLPQPGDAVIPAESSVIHCQLSDSHLAATPAVQTLALQPTLRLAAPSTGWLSDSVKVADRVTSLLNSFDAQQVAQELQDRGYPELVGQRACLEVHLVKQHVDIDSCVSWIGQQTNPASLNRCVDQHCRYLSATASLVAFGHLAVRCSIMCCPSMAHLCVIACAP